MKYLTDLHIRSFRGVKNLKLTELGEINILVGENNSGKTSVLEAIHLIERPLELGATISIGKRREFIHNQSSSYTIFKNMLNMYSGNIHISADVNGEEFDLQVTGGTVSLISESAFSPVTEGFKGEITVKYSEECTSKELMIFQTDSDFIIGNSLEVLPVEYISPVDHLLKNSPNEIIKKGKKNELIHLLNIFDKDINGLEMVEEKNRTVPYIEHLKLGLMPLSTYGDGVRKVLLLGASIINATNGVLLIDEVETAIHIALLDVFDWFVKACHQYNVQVFMTTHSLEVIDSILKSQHELGNSQFLSELLRVITIKKSIDDHATRVRNLNGIDAFEARENYDMELR